MRTRYNRARAMYKKQDMKNNKNLFTLVNVIPFFSRKGGLLSLLLCFLFIHPSIASNEGGVKVIDISQQQVRLMNKYQNSSISERNKILIDSLYTPHQYLWNGYLGNENEFAEWLNKTCLLYTSPSPRDKRQSRMPSSA